MVLTALQRKVLAGRSPEQFEAMYGPRAADRLFGPRCDVKPIRPLVVLVKIAG